MYPSGLAGNVGRERLERKYKGRDRETSRSMRVCPCYGNSIGNFKEYWETYERHPALIGGFIWDWWTKACVCPPLTAKKPHGRRR